MKSKQNQVAHCLGRFILDADRERGPTPSSGAAVTPIGMVTIVIHSVILADDDTQQRKYRPFA